MKNCYGNSRRVINLFSRTSPQAVAQLSCGEGGVSATAMFYQADNGVYTVCSVTSPPRRQNGQLPRLLSVRIGETSHRSSRGIELAPLLCTEGGAWGACFTDRLCVSRIIGQALTIGEASGTIVENVV